MTKNKKYILAWSIVFVTASFFLFLFSNNPIKETGLLLNMNNHLSIDFLDEQGNFELERTDGGFYTFVDSETKKEIDRTARAVFKGDQLIIGDNTLFEVEKIEDDTVYCKNKGKENISWLPQWDAAVSAPAANLIAQETNKSVAIYSTHTAESYVPTSGKDSEPGKGDILNVSQVISEVLQKDGIKTNLSLNKHDPHDANAYQRSRRTAVQLLKKRPATIIDVHRDGVPDPKFYAKKIDGQDATQIRLVVGRQNQNMQANLDYAKQMKAFYDEKKPGLIKGIFIAKGNYNQDLAPRSILIEVGTHTNPLESASNGAATFASFLPEFLGLQQAGGNQGGVGGGDRQINRTIEKGTGSSIIWILAILVIGGAGFLLISSGSVKGSVDRVRNIGKEFTSFLGSRRRK
ncbi:MAG: stage II sporulation protein P [Bacillota bacterium]